MKNFIPKFDKFIRINEQEEFETNKKLIVASIKDGNINMVSFEKSENLDQLDSIYNEQIGYEHDEIYVIEVDDTCWGDDCFIAAKDLQSGNISYGMKILKVYDAISSAENMGDPR